MQPSESAGNETQHFRCDLAFPQIDEFRAEGIRNRFVKARLVDEAAINHRLRNRFSVQLHFAQHVFRL